MLKKSWIFHVFTLVYILGMYFFAGRFSFMALNVLLAWMPVALSFLLIRVRQPLMRLLIGLIWILFYPNIPYLLTDFFHLQVLNIYTESAIFQTGMQEWLTFGALTLGILVFLLVGLFSTLMLVLFFKQHWQLKTWTAALFLLLLTLISSLGIYVGRFLRLHSIHFFLNPFTTVETIFFSWSANKIVFIVIFTILQIALYLVLIWGRLFLTNEEELLK